MLELNGGADGKPNYFWSSLIKRGNMKFKHVVYDWTECLQSPLVNILTYRYPPHGRRTIVIEEGVQWDMIRAPPVDTPAHDLHISNCLNDLCPGDHIEIQWRRNKEFPYGESINTSIFSSLYKMVSRYFNVLWSILGPTFQQNTSVNLVPEIFLSSMHIQNNCHTMRQVESKWICSTYYCLVMPGRLVVWSCGSLGVM